jgi:hypothetical protein
VQRAGVIGKKAIIALKGRAIAPSQKYHSDDLWDALSGLVVSLFIWTTQRVALGWYAGAPTGL